MRVLSINQKNLVPQAVECLRQGGLVIFPTETVYGAGVDATNPAAVVKLLKFKARREGKPLSIAVTDQQMAEQYVELNDQARRLYQRFLPGPMTIVSQGRNQVAPGVESEFGTLGVRIPAYPLVLEIVKALGKPITATSANASGGRRPYSLEDALSSLSTTQQRLIDLALDAGRLPPNPPSTVIDTTLDTPIIFRQGELQPEMTTQATDVSVYTSHSEIDTQALAQRLLLKHWNQVKEQGLVIGLDGDLGTGKTIFTKGVGKFLGVGDELTSPTYTYLQEYQFQRHTTPGTLIHADLWKAEPAFLTDHIEALRPQPCRVVVIEWSHKLPGNLLTPDLRLTFQALGEASRRITYQPT